MSKLQLAEELHRAARRNFARVKTEMRGINDTIQADLVEMIPYATSNHNKKYILTAINIFSKKAYAQPLKTKTGAEVCTALETIINSLGHPIKHIHTDRGKEFYNANVKAMLKLHRIQLYSTFSCQKAAICERFNRTLKNHMWRQFSLRGSHKWIDILPQLIIDYNNTKHRTIRMRPNDVCNEHIEKQLLYSVYNYTREQQQQQQRKRKSKRYQFSVGDSVRLSRYKHIFEKGYTPNWTTEVFTIRKVQSTTDPITYLLKDWRGNDIEGAVYAEELQLTKYPDIYLIEKVLRRKEGKIYVKWLGFDNEFNQWIDDDNLF